MNKFTAGPWTQEEPEHGLIIQAGKTLVAIAQWTHTANDINRKTAVKNVNEAIANACLIASAPELLEALEWAVEGLEIAANRLGMEHGAIKAGKLAIAKAKAEGK